MNARRMLTAAALGLAAVSLVGCSQIAALAPVGGDALAAVRFAANDVLLDHGVDILVAPVCEDPGDGSLRCQGETVEGEEILVTSPAGNPPTMTVTVGSETLYTGSVQDVLDGAAR